MWTKYSIFPFATTNKVRGRTLHAHRNTPRIRLTFSSLAHDLIQQLPLSHGVLVVSSGRLDNGQTSSEILCLSRHKHIAGFIWPHGAYSCALIFQYFDGESVLSWQTVFAFSSCGRQVDLANWTALRAGIYRKRQIVAECGLFVCACKHKCPCNRCN